jgi:phosphonate degradation associated HDIG domain protein
MKARSSKAESVEEVLGLYVAFAEQHYDEQVTQLDHALQTAALAVSEGADDALVVAALLHDVGHLLELEAGATGPGAGDMRHEATGAAYLDQLFGPAVTQPIALHVRAKRYLCAVDAAYSDGLSEGSKRSLEQQGGPLDARSAPDFESLPESEAAVRLRRWDDLGKVDGLTVEPLEHYILLLDRVGGRNTRS